MSYYNQTARNYNELHGEEQLKKLRLIKPFIPEKAKILDVGCGTGLSVILGNVTGIDPSKELLKQAPIKTIQGMAEHLPFPDNSFDIVISITAIHNFDDYKKGLQEMKRVGKKLFIISILKKAKNYIKIKEQIESCFEIQEVIEESMDNIFIAKF